MQKTSIFISYRRSDEPDLAGRIYDYLSRQFHGKRVFMDVESITPGDDFPDRIGSGIEQCDVFLALIGPGWHAAKNRLQSPEDFVARELRLAIRRSKPIIPVLLAGAEQLSAQDLPEDLRQLANLHTAQVRSGPDFRENVRALTKAVEKQLAGLGGQDTVTSDTSDSRDQLERDWRVFLFTDIEDAKELTNSLGESDYQQHVQSPHNKMFRSVLRDFPNARLERDHGRGFFVTFPLATEAVVFALRLQHRLRGYSWKNAQPKVCIGIHSGEVFVARDKYSGVAIDEAACLSGLACGEQILISQSVRDSAQSLLRNELEMPDGSTARIRWERHGNYEIQGSDHDIEVIEVGEEGQAPFTCPQDTANAKRRANELGPWVPVSGDAVPGREPPFILEHEIGRGGFGEVWLARAKYSPPLVFKFCSDVQRLRSFKREGSFFQIIQKTFGDHPGVARIVEVQHETPPFFVAYEYVDGGDLRHWAAEVGGLESVELSQRVDIVVQIARTVANAHSVGIVHRDIKPDNVLMAQEPDGKWRAKLTDFGIASLTSFQTEVELTGLTIESLRNVQSNRSGTLFYRPPESFRSQFIADAKTLMQGDVYALGVVLYQLAVHDFERLPLADWHRHVADELLRDDIEACITDDLTKRLADPNQLADRLESLPERRQQREAEKKAEKAAARNRLLTRIALLLLAGLLTATAFGIAYQRQRDRARTARDLARSAVNDLFVRFSEEDLLNRAGTQVLRRGLLERAKQYYQKLLLPSAGSDGNLPRDVALVHYRLGLIHELLGDNDGAISSYQQAEQIQQAADGTSLGFDLANTLNALGRVHNNLATSDSVDPKARFDRTLDYYQRAKDIRTKLTAADLPRGLGDQPRRALLLARLRANSWMNLGQLKVTMIVDHKLLPQSAMATAKSELEEAQRLREAHIPEALRPGDNSPQELELPASFMDSADLVDIYRDYGKGLVNLGKRILETEPAQAEPFFLQAEAVYTTLRTLDPNRSDVDLMELDYLRSEVYYFAGLAARNQNTDEAIQRGAQSFQQLITALGPMVEQNSHVDKYRSLLAKAWLELGQTFAKDSSTDPAPHQQIKKVTALYCFRKAEEILTPPGSSTGSRDDLDKAKEKILDLQAYWARLPPLVGDIAYQLHFPLDDAVRFAVKSVEFIVDAGDSRPKLSPEEKQTLIQLLQSLSTSPSVEPSHAARLRQSLEAMESTQ